MSLSQIFYEPFYSLAEFDRLFDDAFRARIPAGQQAIASAPDASGRVLKPRMDIHENADNGIVTATFELPGLKKDDVQIDLHNDRLTVSGETSLATDKEEQGWSVRERRFGKFSRTLPLHQGAKAEDVKASMENGVLTVTFPKAAPTPTAKRITID